MGAGVSLSLSRDGVHGESIWSSSFSLISDPFPREHVFYVVSVPFSREQVYYGSFSSRCSVTPKGGYHYASFCYYPSLSSDFLVGANCFRDCPIQNLGSLFPLNGKIDDGCLFPSGYRGLAYASSDLPKKEAEHVSFAAAGSNAPDVTGKISTVGIVNSWVLDLDLRGSRVSDLRLDLLNCIKELPSSEVAGDSRLMAISLILDPVCKFLLLPARGLWDLFSVGYPVSRGYGFGSVWFCCRRVPYGFGIRDWTSSESSVWLGRQVVWHRYFWVPFLVNSDLVESGLCASWEGICGLQICWIWYSPERKIGSVRNWRNSKGIIGPVYEIPKSWVSKVDIHTLPILSPTAQSSSLASYGATTDPVWSRKAAA